MLCGYLLHKIYGFIQVIMVLEDDFSETIESLIVVDEKLEDVIKMPLFYDSPEIRTIVQNALDEVKICRVIVRKAASRFVERSAGEYIPIESDMTLAEEIVYEFNVLKESAEQQENKQPVMEVIR